MHRKMTGTAVIIVLTWLLWSGHFAPLVLALGALSCVTVLLLAKRIGFFDDDVYVLHLSTRLPRFWWWLIQEIVRANLAVARLVLSRRLVLEPVLVRIDAGELPAVAQATLANTITLTPGTLTIDTDDGQLEVHCLDQHFASELLRGEALARTRELAGG